MKGFRYAVAIVSMVGISNLASGIPVSAQDHRSRVDLYVRPQPDERHQNGSNPDDVEEIRSDEKKIDPIKARPQDFPSLYKDGRKDGVIVVFGFPSCGWCRVQESVIPKGYRVLKAHYAHLDTKVGPKWVDLMNQWKLYDKDGRLTYPTSVVVVDGKPVAVYRGYHVWLAMKKSAEPAKLETEELEETIKFRRWIRPRSESRHVPKWGRWSKRN